MIVLQQIKLIPTLDHLHGKPSDFILKFIILFIFSIGTPVLYTEVMFYITNNNNIGDCFRPERMFVP